MDIRFSPTDSSLSSAHAVRKLLQFCQNSVKQTMPDESAVQ